MSFDLMKRLVTYGDRGADNLLIQCIDEHDASGLDSEMEYLRQHSQQSFLLLAVKVGSWNGDLSPWKAPAVWGSEGFGEGASDTLKYIIDTAIPSVRGELNHSADIYIGGYSLAAFFALWAGYQSPIFKGVAAASPSVWFQSWMDYASSRPFLAPRCYLSLGRKEEKTRNQVMARVGDCIRRQKELLDEGGVDCVLEWNDGNHFTEPDVRTAKAFSWLLG